MFKLFMGTALLHLPTAIPCGMLCFIVARWSLQRKSRIGRVVVRVGFLLCFTILTAGMIYGALRFSGTIMFADDNCISYNWFGASWRDDGFNCIYGFGAVFMGLVTAFLFESRDVDRIE